jgi:hypothetical protein
MEIKKLLWWFITIILGYVAFVVVNMPASSALKLLKPYGITATRSSGSVWNGNAVGLRSKNLNIETLEWQVRPLKLLVGKISSAVKAQLKDGVVQGNISRDITGQIEINNLTATLPIQSLIGSSEILKGWDGLLKADLVALTLKDEWPIAIEGTFDLIDLTEPSAVNNLGGFRLSFTSSDDRSTAVIGKFTDLPDAAIGISGSLKLSGDRNYLLDLYLTPRDITPASIMSRIKYLGPTDAQGRYPLSISGTF